MNHPDTAEQRDPATEQAVLNRDQVNAAQVLVVREEARLRNCRQLRFERAFGLRAHTARAARTRTVKAHTRD